MCTLIIHDLCDYTLDIDLLLCSTHTDTALHEFSKK